MEVLVAQDAPTPRAYAALEQIDAAMALVAVRGYLRTTEEFDLWHRSYKDVHRRAGRQDEVTFHCDGFRRHCLVFSTDRAGASRAAPLARNFCLRRPSGAAWRRQDDVCAPCPARRTVAGGPAHSHARAPSSRHPGSCTKDGVHVASTGGCYA